MDYDTNPATAAAAVIPVFLTGCPVITKWGYWQ